MQQNTEVLADIVQPSSTLIWLGQYVRQNNEQDAQKRHLISDFN